MKKFMNLVSLLIIMSLLFSSCASKEVKTDTPPDTSPVTEEALPPEDDGMPEEIKAFFDQYVYTKTRPIAVMIDNDNNDARPQAGLEDAYLIYEIIIEGGATRYMALFNNTSVDKIGPVRSSRHYFLDYLMENDAIYVHYGWSPKAQSDISSFKINKINGVNGGDDKIFWRDRTYTKAWHSAFTSTENILKKAEEKNYSTTTGHKNSITYSKEYIVPESGKDALNISLRYSDMYRTGYVYNEESSMYEKTINGKPYKMQSGNPVAVKNIIVELASDVSLGDGSDRRDVKTTGTGKGYYITNGKCEEITWAKPSRKENTVYTKKDGTPLVINPGKTFVNIINPSANITIE